MLKSILNYKECHQAPKNCVQDVACVLGKRSNLTNYIHELKPPRRYTYVYKIRMPGLFHF